MNQHQAKWDWKYGKIILTCSCGWKREKATLKTTPNQPDISLSNLSYEMANEHQQHVLQSTKGTDE